MKVLILGSCGYIGSRVYNEIQKISEFKISTLDCEWFGNPGVKLDYSCYYQKLSESTLKNFDAIILLAGNSSVGFSVSNPELTLQNNLTDPIALIKKLSDQQMFIYASSSSVYSGYKSTLADEEVPLHPATNIYDYSKAAFDNFLISTQSKKQYFGLRFGTVCGPSSSLRPELMINSMVKAGVLNKMVNLANGGICRPILGISDLCRALVTILKGSSPDAGIYNLHSFNSTASEIAFQVCKATGAEINYLPDSPTYNFSISSKKFQTTFEFSPQDTPASLIQDLIAFYKAPPHFERKSNVRPIA